MYRWRATTFAFWHKWQNHWQPDGLEIGSAIFGGVTTSDPAAVSSWASVRIDLVARAATMLLIHKCFDRAWSVWESLGGTLTSGPAAVVLGLRPLRLIRTMQR